MQERYEPAAVEADAQHYWENQRCFEQRKTRRDKYYCLSMFPYRAVACTWARAQLHDRDVLSRFMRMNGKNVLQPMVGRFCLPAENAAMANGVPPAKWTFDILRI